MCVVCMCVCVCVLPRGCACCKSASNRTKRLAWAKIDPIIQITCEMTNQFLSMLRTPFCKTPVVFRGTFEFARKSIRVKRSRMTGNDCKCRRPVRANPASHLICVPLGKTTPMWNQPGPYLLFHAAVFQVSREGPALNQSKTNLSPQRCRLHEDTSSAPAIPWRDAQTNGWYPQSKRERLLRSPRKHT